MYRGGSNALGLFYPFLNNEDVKIIGIEAGGKGINSKMHAASLSRGKPGFLHGNYTYLLQNEEGQITDAHSISAGLDYPGIGPNIHGSRKGESKVILVLLIKKR